MKKTLFTILFSMGILGTLFAEKNHMEPTSANNDMEFRYTTDVKNTPDMEFRFTDDVNTSDIKAFKDAVILRLPNVKYDATNPRAFFLSRVPSEIQQKLVKSLKDNGYNIKNDPKYTDMHTYVVRPIQDGGKILLFEVDSSAFKDNINRLKELQLILGTAVSGGKNDPFKITKGELVSVKDKLCLAQFSFVFGKTEDGFETITLAERPNPVYLPTTNQLQLSAIMNLLNNSAIRYTLVNQTVCTVMFAEDLKSFQQQLQNIFGNIQTEVTNFSFVIVPAAPEIYLLDILLIKNNKDQTVQAVINTLEEECGNLGYIVESFETRSTGSITRVSLRVATYEKQHKLESKIKKLLSNKHKILHGRITLCPAE